MSETQQGYPPPLPPHGRRTLGFLMSLTCIFWTFMSISSILDCVLVDEPLSAKVAVSVVADCLSIGLALWVLLPHKKDSLPQTPPILDSKGRAMPRFYARFIPAFFGQVFVFAAGLVFVYWLSVNS